MNGQYVILPDEDFKLNILSIDPKTSKKHYVQLMLYISFYESEL